MGSIVALRRSVETIPRLEQALAASAGRPLGQVTSFMVGDWALGVCGDDIWSHSSEEVTLVGTGVIDDLGDPKEAGAAAAGALAAGKRGLAGLRGVYSVLAVRRGVLWAWRDHLGFSPLFAAGSEPSAVATTAGQALAAADLPARPDVELIQSIFWGAEIDDQASYLEGARRVPKASVLRVEGGKSLIERYWEPTDLLESRRSREDPGEEFRLLLARAATRALGPKPVVALSGGIDAPAVAAFAAGPYRERTGRPLPALSAVYPDLPRVDESRYIKLMADRYGLDLDTFVPAAGPLAEIGRWLRIAEGPVPTVSLAESAEYYRAARERGHQTILTGEMAEFVMALGGYTLRHLMRQGRFGAVGRFLQAERGRGIPLLRLARSVVSSALPAEWIRGRHERRGRLPQQRVPWLPERSWAAPAVRADPWSDQQVSAFVGPGFSVEADEALQSASGVRVRRPWLDIDLWEFFLSLPAEIKYPSGQYKAAVRRWLRGWVPDEILDRRDRTYFDDSFFARLDYSVLRRLIASDGYRMPGVDYDLLLARLDTENLPLLEAMWAKDLAVIHAFLEEWS